MVFFNFYAIFLEISIMRWLERNRTSIVIFFLSRPFPTYFGYKWSHTGIFYFFAIFFGNFNYAPGTDRTKLQFLFSPFLIFFQPILARNGAIMVFFSFLNFFVIFLQFSITRQVGTERNDNFYFLPFSFSFNLFWLEMEP